MRRRRLSAEKPQTPRAFAVGSAVGGWGSSLIMTNLPGRCANASATDSAEGGGCKVRIRREGADGDVLAEDRLTGREQTFYIEAAPRPCCGDLVSSGNSSAAMVGGDRQVMACRSTYFGRSA